MNADLSETAQFLNVDLEVASRTDLAPLEAALGKRVFTLYIGRQRRTYRAHFELSRSTNSADATIRGFCALIEKLPKDARKHWGNATRRDFSVGIQAGDKPSTLDTVLEAETVQAAARVNARIVFTLYAPGRKSS